MDFSEDPVLQVIVVQVTADSEMSWSFLSLPTPKVIPALQGLYLQKEKELLGRD
jgi:hypothetical protein